MKHHKKYDTIISQTLSIFHANKNYLSLLLTIVCNPERISCIDAWSKSAENMDKINEILKTHPNYVYSIGVIEPHINSSKQIPKYDGVLENVLNPKVEVEEYFTHRVKPPCPGQSAISALEKINIAIQEYQSTLGQYTAYQILRHNCPSNSKRSRYGYPKFLIVMTVNSTSKFPHAEEVEAFLETHLPSHLCRKTIKAGRFAQSYLKSSNIENRHINDTKILLFALKNTNKIYHENLIGRLSAKLYNAPIEVVSIFKALNVTLGHQVDYGNIDGDIEYKRVTIGSGVAPPSTSLPTLAPFSKTHNCMIAITSFMRRHNIYLDETTTTFYKHMNGSVQTYVKYGTIDVLLNAIGVEFPDNVEILKQNDRYIKNCSKSKESFFDKIIMTYKWIEYDDFCLNISSGTVTPKDSRYPCFAFYPNIKYSDTLWCCNSTPQVWLTLLMELKIVTYDYSNVGRLKIAKNEILNRLYEILIPREDSIVRNLSLSDEKIFTLLMTPIISLYKDSISCYDNLINYNKEDVEKSQLILIINPKLSRKFNIEKMCNNYVTKSNGRTVIIDTLSSSQFPSWAYVGEIEEHKLYKGFLDAYDTLYISDSNLTNEQMENMNDIHTELTKETGSIILHLAISYFSSLGGIEYYADPKEIDTHIANERAKNHILEKYKNTLTSKGSSYVKRTIPVLSEEELFFLQNNEERKETPYVCKEVPESFTKLMSNFDWRSYNGNRASSHDSLSLNLIKHSPTTPKLPPFPF